MWLLFSSEILSSKFCSYFTHNYIKVPSEWTAVKQISVHYEVVWLEIRARVNATWIVISDFNDTNEFSCWFYELFVSEGVGFKVSFIRISSSQVTIRNGIIFENFESSIERNIHWSENLAATSGLKNEYLPLTLRPDIRNG